MWRLAGNDSCVLSFWICLNVASEPKTSGLTHFPVLPSLSLEPVRTETTPLSICVIRDVQLFVLNYFKSFAKHISVASRFPSFLVYLPSVLH
jgi:hypothetical protein